MSGILTLLTAAALFPAGCDDPNTSELDGYFESHPLVTDPRSTSTQIVKINPSSATVGSIGSRIVFTASGGNGGYTWDISNTSAGSITPSGKSQAVYVSSAVGNNEIIVYDKSGNAAIATISVNQENALTIKAEPQELAADDDMAILTASGGNPTYTWRVSDPTRGKFPSGNTGPSVVYRRISAGDNAVTVTDSSGNSRSLIISQP